MGDVGWVAKAFYAVFDWVTGKNGLEDFVNRRQGDRLESKANDALHAWKLDPTEENWRAYKYAEAELVNWSNAP